MKIIQPNIGRLLLMIYSENISTLDVPLARIEVYCLINTRKALRI